MKQLTWFESFLVALVLALAGLLILGLAFSTTRQSALATIGTLAGIAALTLLVKAVSGLAGIMAALLKPKEEQ